MRMMVMLGLALMLAGLVGCNQTPRDVKNAIELYRVGQFGAAEAKLKPRADKRDENYVLNNCRYASCALAAGDMPSALHGFTEAYKLMNSGNVNDDGRKTAAAVFFEGAKVWPGEPFERAMAHYYLGMIYLMQHDYGNARAAFQNSIFKVREYAKKDDPDHYQAVESTFALGYFGLGYCNMRMGNQQLADQNFGLAMKYDASLAQMIADAKQPGMNTLIFVDSGFGPRRAPKGWYNEESAFGPTPAEAGPIFPVSAMADGQPLTRPNEIYSTVDTLAMAQDQKWQDIDTIKKTKAVIGTGLMAGGAAAAGYGAATGDSRVALIGLGIAALGGATAASSQSDLRYWEMLPRTVYIIPATLPPGAHDISVSANGASSPVLHTQIAPPEPGQAETVLYFRLLGAQPILVERRR